MKLVVIKESNIHNHDFQYIFSIKNKKGKEGKRFLRKNHFENYL